MDWLEARTPRDARGRSPLQIVYGIDGRRDLTENGAGPPGGLPRLAAGAHRQRGAYSQLQLDIYGELMDSVYLYNKYGTPISYDLDGGYPRPLGGERQLGPRGRGHLGDPRRPQPLALQADVLGRGRPRAAAGRQTRLSGRRPALAGGTRPHLQRDHATRLEPGARRSSSTTAPTPGRLPAAHAAGVHRADRPALDLHARRHHRRAGLRRPGLPLRLDATPDGLAGREATFNLCTFWLVEALTRAGRLDDARLLFEKMLGYANHLGLYAEQPGLTGEALGNFPQAFTHLALISAAFNLDRQLG